MELIENQRSLSLSEDEFNIICQIIPPPFGDIQKYINELKFTRTYLNEMIQLLRQNLLKKEIVVQDGFLKDLCLAFKICCDIIDPLEIQTVTGHTWLEVMKIYDKLYIATFAG